jgi:hypothetical protein
MTYYEKLLAAAEVAKQLEANGLRIIGSISSCDGDMRLQLECDDFKSHFAGQEVRRETSGWHSHYYAEIDGIQITACEEVRDTDLVLL